MKYPAIYRTRQGADYLYASKDSYYSYTLKDWGESTFSDINEHLNDKNITAEYLTNTYGEVKSKEHAEFIVKLAEVNGLINETVIAKGFPCWFSFSNDEIYLFDDEVFAKDNGEKQITIPLPPECESVDEWPKVGSKALLNNDNDYELDYGENLIGKEIEVINLFTDGELDMAVVKHDVANYCFRIEMLSKPKTKEEKERDEIKEEIKEIFREAMKSPFGFIYDSDEKAANYLLERFDITKKPQ